MKIKQINQNEVTSECWGIQIWGLSECDRCEYKNTTECGGKKIRKTGKNEKGLKVPLGNAQEFEGSKKMMPKRTERVIWSNMPEDLNVETWNFGDGNDFTADEKLQIVNEDNYRFLDDERDNLNITLPNRILVIANLGLWNGRKQGYKIIDSCNISHILSDKSDFVKWYSDGYNIRATAIHHDGTNHYEYRIITDENKCKKLLDKIYYQKPYSRRELNQCTRSILKPIATVYGW